jgi:probable phosphoglycerate mutase
VSAAANDPAEPRKFPQSRFVPLPGSCELLLLRHGESAPHVEGEDFPLVDGHGDPPLTEEGREQAEQAAERLIATGERIAAVYVTTLQRTHQTAAPLVARLGIEPKVEPELREVFLGDWEGGEFRKRLADGDPIAMRMATEQRWDVIPGAEPQEAFGARVRLGIEKIAAAHPDQLVVAVVHGGVIGEVIGQATGAKGFAFTGADNASLSHVVVTPDRWIVRCYNDTTHLRTRFSTAPEPLI